MVFDADQPTEINYDEVRRLGDGAPAEDCWWPAPALIRGSSIF